MSLIASKACEKETELPEKAYIVQRVPTGLWTHLQDLTARMDDAFLRDVARITKYSFTDLRRLFPTRGLQTQLAVDTNMPWWHDQQCHMSSKNEQSGMWLRCSSVTMEGRCCIKHRNSKCGSDMKFYDDPYFKTLPKRLPYRINGEVMWVDEDTGKIYTLSGILQPNIVLHTQYGWLEYSE